MLLLTPLAGLSLAGAQTWDVPNENTYILKRCYPSSEAIRCDLTFSHIGDTPGLLNISTGSFSVVTSDGKTVEASKVAAGGAGFTTGGFQSVAYKGAPLQVSLIFNVPTTTATFPVMVVESVPINNVGVVGAAPLGPTSTPAPASGNAYTAVLTNCKAEAKGVLMCTATLTPRR